LVALKAVARCPEKVASYEVGFHLAPRLNAAGRLESAHAALQLLLSQDAAECQGLAERLDEQNRERQRIERSISKAAIEAVRARFDPQRDFVIVEGQSPWHVGVVGIVASRVLSEFYRPTIIVGGDGVGWRGSGRSIAGFDLAAALRECKELLVKHGGHAMAAGVTVMPDQLEAFLERLNQVARERLRPEDLQPLLRLASVACFNELTPNTLSALSRVHPTGQGNPPIQLYCQNLAHYRPLQRVGAEKQHVRMWVTDGHYTLEAMWWNAGEEALPVGRFDLAFAPELNHFNGRTAVRLKVLDWRPAVAL
jgi:single-stranded-DNA-specific exonuclease